MIFNSFEYAIFLPLTFILYWFVFSYSIKFQNLFLLVAGYVFYGWWDWRFLGLLVLSSTVDYIVGLLLDKYGKPQKRKLILALSLVFNIGLLGFFKYYNFFIDNFILLFHEIGIELSPRTLNVILPVGISFYTFQSLRYTIDVYNKKLAAVKDYIGFLAYVSFFPQLVAGPIEKPQNLIPQFFKVRKFDYYSATSGCRQILWGLFKKIVVADICAGYVDSIIANYNAFNGSTLLLGAVYFSFQIYGDFSGYSDIALGTARMFGFELMKNFNFPYFSRNIGEFWRRWHISLSSWFRDYVYIPMGGSYGDILSRIRNIAVIFILSGFWHGAKWTFIVWGALHALYYIPLVLLNKHNNTPNIVAHNRMLPTLKELFQLSITFVLVVFAWIFFRAESMSQAIGYIKHMFTHQFLSMPWSSYINFQWIIIMVLIEWISRKNNFGLEKVNLRPIVRYSFYMILVLLILKFFNSDRIFIYFQF